MRTWADLTNHRAEPVTALPADYREVHYLSVNERGVLLWLNVFSLVPLLISGLLVFGALIIYHGQLNGLLVVHALPDELPSWAGFIVVLAVLPLHEWVHGLVIRWFGHRPRYGVKWLVLFATSDGALFRRNEFIRIALAPLVLISAAAGIIMPFLPMGLAYWLGLAIVVNAAGAVGDLWMTAVVLRFEPSVLIRDEEDSMRIFAAV